MMDSSIGFPDNSRFTPVPNLLFGTLLEQMDDLRVLKCLLRIVWLHSQKKGFPRFLTREELMADRTLARALARDGSSFDIVLGDTLESLEKLGLLLHLQIEAGQGAVDAFMPNTQEGRKAAQYLASQTPNGLIAAPGKPQTTAAARPNIFELYEENIGIIGPLLAEELKEAEESYPPEWVEEAFREAVTHNKRNWRYIEAILKGWTTEGREHGEPGRHSKKVDAKEWIRRHGLPRPS